MSPLFMSIDFAIHNNAFPLYDEVRLCWREFSELFLLHGHRQSRRNKVRRSDFNFTVNSDGSTGRFASLTVSNCFWLSRMHWKRLSDPTVEIVSIQGIHIIPGNANFFSQIYRRLVFLCLRSTVRQPDLISEWMCEFFSLAAMWVTVWDAQTINRRRSLFENDGMM
jgi:hypothetical protein